MAGAVVSKLARAVEYFAARPQVQERLTKQVADLLQAELQPSEVEVIIEACSGHCARTPVHGTNSSLGRRHRIRRRHPMTAERRNHE